MADNDWLKSLKPGDTVILVSCGMGGGEEVKTVERVWKRFFTLNGLAINFSTQDGRRTPRDTWSRLWVEQANPERIAAANEARLVSILRRKCAERLDAKDPFTSDQLSRALAILNESPAGSAAGKSTGPEASQ